MAAWADFNLMSCVTRIQQTAYDSVQTVYVSLQNIHQNLQYILQESTGCLGQLCIVLYVIRGWRLLGPPLA